MENSEVRIIHTKKEQSHDPNPLAHFEFEWAMASTLAFVSEPVTTTTVNASPSTTPTNSPPNGNHAGHTLSTPPKTNLITPTKRVTISNDVIVHTENRELELQNVDFWIIDYNLDEGFDKNNKPVLTKLLQKFFHPDTNNMYVSLFFLFLTVGIFTSVRCIWSKYDIFEVNVHRDFSRLAIKTTINDIDQKVVVRFVFAVIWTKLIFCSYFRLHQSVPTLLYKFWSY